MKRFGAWLKKLWEKPAEDEDAPAVSISLLDAFVWVHSMKDAPLECARQLAAISWWERKLSGKDEAPVADGYGKGGAYLPHDARWIPIERAGRELMARIKKEEEACEIGAGMGAKELESVSAKRM